MPSSLDNRRPAAGLVFLFGAGLGAACYLLAESLVPLSVPSAGQHDLLLANRLGFVYPPLVGIWLGWLQRSWARAVLGALLGLLVGVLYLLLCGRNFLAVMVAFSCLLGGAFAALAGSNREPWLRGLAARLGKGLVAGFVLGLVYMVVLNAGAPFLIDFDNKKDFTSRYVAMMWRVGPVALGLASGVFLILLRWAVGLSDQGVVAPTDVSKAAVQREGRA